ncbi:alpha/beta fold hydrolase [Rossellomorea marisflavi]|uniref:alpha/beta fold hydrolase n=1 Tax=Rossellomorea marisflavi TaxID=189381 RepID=UPI00288A4618|nr:alpha/beta fold hydrolase [Rossellomorea marisflavi]
MSSDTTPYELNTVTLPSLVLENGETLRHVKLPYERTGNQSGPVILVCHALTGTHIVKGTSEDRGWWDGLIGAGSYIDTNRYNVIAFNVLGGCEGATGPASENPGTGRRYGSRFPTITIRDMVNAQYLASGSLLSPTWKPLLEDHSGECRPWNGASCIPAS